MTQKVEIKDNSNDVHLIPNFPGEPEHTDTINCWCEPEIEEPNDPKKCRVITHRRPH